MRKTGPYKGDRSERILLGIATLLQLAILGVVISALTQQQWLIAFAGSIVLTLSFAPAVIEKQSGLQLPVEFTFIICVILYASFGLGEIGDFYHKIWWWDLMLHSLSALVIGLTGFLAIYVFYMTNRIRMAPIFVAMVTFGFAVTIGTLWEVFEFLMDWFFGFNMQKSGLIDTMTDFLVNIGGSLVAAVIGYNYVKDGDSMIAEKIVRHFVEKNPQLFSVKEK